MLDQVDVFLQTGANSWLSFNDHALVIRADSVEHVRAAISDVERLTREAGLHAAGFVAYEAGLAFGIPTAPPSSALPLVWFALFEPRHVHPAPPPRTDTSYSLGPVAPSVDRGGFEAAFARVKAFLADGDSYQVNFTFKMRAPFHGDAWALFADLVGAQEGRHSAFIRTGDWSVCSASPELFFAIDGLRVCARPMKGTAVRGRTLEEDRAQRDRLRSSAKQQAENVMIVDMVRNDLGRIAVTGTIEVPELFTVERYPNVWQMTSSVTGRSAASLEEIFAALHPSASVTGAPKVRTAQILAALEGEPRGVYTGAIGHIPPDGNAAFNVAIRTAVVDHRANTIEFGVGSGIVWDSDAAAEYAECLAKGSVLGRRQVRFELLETLRWHPGAGFALLERHLARLRDAAEYFAFDCDVQRVRTELQRAVEGQQELLRVRVLVAREGSVHVEHAPLSIDDRPVRAVVGSAPVDSGDVFLFHKTTSRQVYDRARAAAPACDDVILWNERGEITESTVANVVAEIAGTRWTPPVESGLLAGTYRAELLERGEIRERVISVEELRAATRVWLVNSVQGEREAVLE